MTRLADLSTFARALLPRPLFRVARQLGTALIAPVSFSLGSGHLRSSFAERAMDSRGRPIPWYTYPAIAFLESLDLSELRVLEWGAGQSTLWWGERAKRVVSFEGDPSWARHVTDAVGTNVAVHAVESSLDHRVAETLEAESPFDIVVVDGLDRFGAAKRSLSVLGERGCLIQDDSEGYWGGEADRTYPIVETMRTAGFGRVDFYGYSPGVVSQHCTSIYFKPECALFKGESPPQRLT